MLRRILLGLLLLIVIAWVVQTPAVAGATVHGWWDSFWTFVHSATGGS